jgi:DNA adenine methylase
LFKLAQKHRGDLLLTYDNALEVRALAAQHGFVVHPIAMKSTHNSEISELLIGRNLSWVL